MTKCACDGRDKGFLFSPTPPRGGRNAPASEGVLLPCPPLSLMPAIGAPGGFYSRPPIILLLNFFGVSNRINIELTGMSVRALEKPNSFGAKRIVNPMMSVPLHRYFYHPRLWLGCRCNIMNATGSLNC